MELVEAPNDGIPSSSKGDEPNLFFKLHGRNEVSCVEMWGWTNAIPLRFPTLKPDLRMKTLDSIEEFDDVKSYAEKLETIARYAYCSEYTPLTVPVVVQVIAKKKTDLVILQKKGTKKEALLIATLLVADDTGVCICTLMNESVQVIHDEVKVGDFLVIRKGSYKPTYKEDLKYNHPFYEYLLNLELKLEKFSVRYNQLVTLKAPVISLKFPNYLFNLEKDRLWTASDLLNDSELVLALSQSQSQQFNPSKGKSYDYLYFDILGVVTSVGRIERVEVYEGEVECLLNAVEGKNDYNDTETIKGTYSNETVKQYTAFRWIQIVDRESQPLSVKIYLKKSTIKSQIRIIPGALILLSHCVKKHYEAMEDCVQTSVYTGLYLNEDIETYFKLMPIRYWKFPRVMSIIDLSSYKEILKRADIQWTAGGTIQQKLKSPTAFLNHYYGNLKKDEEKKQSESSRIDSLKNLSDTTKKSPDKLLARESFSTSFRGKIDYVKIVTEEESKVHVNVPGIVILGKYKFWTKPGKCDRNDGWPLYSNSRCCLCRKCEHRNWFSFARILPPLRVPSNSENTRDLCKAVTDKRSKYCEPLLMPSPYSPMPKLEVPLLGKCKKVQGHPFYLVGIKDEDNKRWYEAVFKSFPFDVMTKKCEEARGKNILAVIDIYKHGREPYSEEIGYEVTLRDFVIDDYVKITNVVDKVVEVAVDLLVDSEK